MKKIFLLPLILILVVPSVAHAYDVGLSAVPMDIPTDAGPKRYPPITKPSPPVNPYDTAAKALLRGQLEVVAGKLTAARHHTVKLTSLLFTEDNAFAMIVFSEFGTDGKPLVQVGYMAILQGDGYLIDSRGAAGAGVP